MLGLLMAKLMMAAIPLTGVVGETLRTRAFFDANNVKVGDPLVLTLDFIGTADFASLHPPALSKLVDRKDWKLDDASAKTETYRDARRLTYRVRPLHPGVLWFPELEFTYTDAQGGERRIRSNAIPVHVRPGVDVVVDDLPEHEVKMPQPDALMTDCDESAALDADGDFAWRKACAHPTADAFAAFDFPAAKFNEARCAILEGDWRRALSVYARLEWRVGQSPALERGLVAAIAVRDANPLAELPVWRFRPAVCPAWEVCAKVGLSWTCGVSCGNARLGAGCLRRDSADASGNERDDVNFRWTGHFGTVIRSSSASGNAGDGSDGAEKCAGG